MSACTDTSKDKASAAGEGPAGTPPRRHTPLADPIAAEAVAWAVRLSEGSASPSDYEAYAAWRRQDPRHETAAARLEGSLNLFTHLPATPDARQGARRALLAPPRRRMLKSALGLGFLALGSGMVLHRYEPLPQLLADVTTSTGERKQLTLPDGSRLWLNARSAVDVDFRNNARTLFLRAGELIAEIAPSAQHPFVVHCTQGSVRSQDARFLLRQDKGIARVSVLRAGLVITPRLGSEAPLSEGSSARFDAFSVQPDAIAPQHASAWEDGFIEIHDRPLEEVVAALRAYRPGLLRISPQAARLRVTGSFPLDDTERTLAALAEALPVNIQRRTGYWVSIDAR